MLRVTGPKSINACQNDQLYAGLKAVIDRDVHGFQSIWDENLSTEYWGFLLVDAKNVFNEINRIIILRKVRSL